MANKKISQLPSGGLLQPGDLIPVARNGTNVTVLGGFLAPRKRGPWNSDTESAPALSTYVFPANSSIPSWSYKTGVRNGDGTDLKTTTTVLPTVLGFDGNYPTEDASIGTNAVLASPKIGSNQRFVAQFTANASNAAKLLTINYSVTSEGGYDFFRVYVDSTKILEASGNDATFKEFQYEMPTGQHLITLEYSKDGSADQGFDGFRVSRLIVPQSVFAVPYKFGDIVTYNGKTYSCQTNGAGIDSVPSLSPADWLLIPYDLSSDIDSLGTKVVEVDNRPPGLPYAYSGKKKFRYWKVGIRNLYNNVTRLFDVSLRTTVDTPMPQIASYNLPVNSQGASFQPQWFDTVPDTTAGTATFGQAAIIEIDFGTPQLIKFLTVIPDQSGTYAMDVQASEDGVTYTTILNNYEIRDTVVGVQNSIELNLPNFTGLTGYNLTANPQLNVGRFVKVNNDGTGFDFGDIVAAPDEGSAFHIGFFGGDDVNVNSATVAADTSPTSPNFALQEANNTWTTIAALNNVSLRPAVRSVTVQFSHIDDIAAWPGIASFMRLRLTHPSTQDVEILVGPVPTNVVANQQEFHLTFYTEDTRNGNGFNYELQYLPLSSSGGGTVNFVNQGIQIVEWPQV